MQFALKAGALESCLALKNLSIAGMRVDHPIVMAKLLILAKCGPKNMPVALFFMVKPTSDHLNERKENQCHYISGKRKRESPFDCIFQNKVCCGKVQKGRGSDREKVSFRVCSVATKTIPTIIMLYEFMSLFFDIPRNSGNPDVFSERPERQTQKL